ncbi:MAG TPA: formate dehydrogenase subunit delta [Magnetospirillaceae bacterium]|jgi:formate dehydrogenase subunit delta
MSGSSTDRLVHDANQIARYFASYPRDEALAGVVDHIKKFWERRMRAQIILHVAHGGAGLDELALAAVKQLPPVAGA